MSNDITALMATMKAAAEKATPGEWRYLKTTPFMDAEISAANNTRIVNLLAGDVNSGHSEFIATANPANVKTLVEALEKAQHDAAVNWEAAASMNVENQELKQRIAELESRTVTVKLPYLPDDCDRTEAHFKYQAALTAAGIQVIEGDA